MPILYGSCMGNVASTVYVILERRYMQYAVSHAKVTQLSFYSYMLRPKYRLSFTSKSYIKTADLLQNIVQLSINILPNSVYNATVFQVCTVLFHAERRVVYSAASVWPGTREMLQDRQCTYKRRVPVTTVAVGKQ
jgi:hypothetical protein